MTGSSRLMPMRVVLLALVALALLASPAAAQVLKVGDRIAELDTAVDARGKAVKLKAYKGKWILVTVGAEWCKPCAKELPTWDKLAGEMKGKITFIAIDIDDDMAAGKRFHDKLKIKNMTKVYMPADKSGVVARYGSDTMPTTFIFDKSGVVRDVKKGFAEGDASGEYKKMKAQLEKLVK